MIFFLSGKGVERVKMATFTGMFSDKLPFGSFLVRTNVEDTPLQVPYRVLRRGAQRIERGGGPGPAPAIPNP